MAWVLEVVTCSSAPKTMRFFQHIFFRPSQQENASDSEESSEEEVRVGQVPKMNVWRGRPVCVKSLRFFEVGWRTNSWCTGKHNPSSDRVWQICYQNGSDGQRNSAWWMEFSCFSESWGQTEACGHQYILPALLPMACSTGQIIATSPNLPNHTISGASVGFNPSDTTSIPLLR